jgi:hypothetical protein
MLGFRIAENTHNILRITGMADATDRISSKSNVAERPHERSTALDGFSRKGSTSA